MLGLIHLLLIGFVIFVALTTWMVVDRLRHPPRRTYASAVSRGQPGDPSEMVPSRAFREFGFDASGVSLPGWDIAGDRHADPGAPIIICTPGWGESRLGVLPRLAGLAGEASRVIAWDPPGLGDAPGSCGLGTESDVRALLALVEVVSVTADGVRAPIVLFGWSMGAGVSLHAAAELARMGRPAMAVIAEAPYRHAATPVVNYLALTRMPHRMQRPLAMWWLGWRLRRSLDWRSFDRAGYAAVTACALLVIHGTSDEICPIDDGRAIAVAASRSLLIAVEGAGHNDLWTDERFRVQCIRAIADFLPAARASTRLA